MDAIDLERRSISVVQSLTETDEIRPPKTASGVRQVSMPTIVAAAFLDWFPHMLDDARGLIFRSNSGGNFLKGSLFYEKWSTLLERAGIERTARGWRHFHALRHYAGSAWIDAGATIPEVSRLLGHANPAITAKIYAHALTPSDHHAPLIERCSLALLEPPIAQPLRIVA
jgi:integrase